MKANIINFIALTLYLIFACAVVGGGVLLWKARGRRRLAGAPLALFGLGAAATLTLMCSKYWFGDSDFFAAFIDVPLGSLAINAATAFAALVAAGALVLALGRLLATSMQGERWWRALLSVGGVLVFVGVGGTGSLIALSAKPAPESPTQIERRIVARNGFTVETYASGPIHVPTSLAAGPDGRLYVSDMQGRVWAIADHNGKAAEPALFADHLDRPIGLAWRGDTLYVAVHSQILTLRDGDGDGRADERRAIVTGLPARLYPLHQNNGLAFGPDGRLYFGLGSTSDSEDEQNRMAASIMSVNPDGSDLKVYARGIRNAYDLAFNQAGDLFATENQPAGLPVVPGEELNHIVADGNYGFPYYYEQPPPDSASRGPLYVFPPHSSPDGITFYQGRRFPAEYRDNGFLVTWMRGEVYRVQLVKGPDGEYLSRVSLFITGMQNPLDIVAGPDDNLYVADYGTSVIYRISYTGRDAANPVATSS